MGLIAGGIRPMVFSSQVYEMETQYGTNGNGKIEALRKKEAAIKAALAAETVKQHKRKQKEAARLASIIGAALMEACAKQPDTVGVMIRQLLQSSELREIDRALLSGKGWA
jgi:hypothetical protein